MLYFLDDILIYCIVSTSLFFHIVMFFEIMPDYSYLSFVSLLFGFSFALIQINGVEHNEKIYE